MSSVTQGAGDSAADKSFDLSQFYEVFFEEANENLAAMEQMLLAIDVDNPKTDDLHAIFRAAHSIKGGAATFGFSDVTELTHELETLLDRVRRNDLAMTAGMVDALLESGDVVKAQLAGHHPGATRAEIDTTDLVARIRALATVTPKAPSGLPAFDMVIGPCSSPATFESIAELFAEIANLGTLETLADAEAGADHRRYRVTSATPREELCDLMGFHVSREQIRFIEHAPAGAHSASPATSAYEIYDGPHDAVPDHAGTPSSAANARASAAGEHPEGATPPARPAARGDHLATAQADSTTLRVAVDKVDQLINLVGELVITQAVLSNRGRAIDPIAHAGVVSGLADLERNTRSLQEAVMGIRMIPMAVVFNRFPRMLRDLAAKLGKQVDLKTSGEATELDKGLIEKIIDPLTHLIRNAVDHGIEMPEHRLDSGKPARGTIWLSASHRGGSIVIEVKDDGAGLNREKILKKARERGLEVSDSMTDGEVWQLIWAPGFSTADTVTDVSGRGVGMDVVTKNITALGGTAEIESEYGSGTRVSVRLPLTLAIMDGMSVAVDGGIFILPLSNIIESMQLADGMLKTVAAQGIVVQVRSEFLTVVALSDVLEGSVTAGASATAKILVIVEADGAKVALIVDELIGQHQVVVKNLESNYRRVPGVSGATIMGDGRVALILDASFIVGAARAKSAGAAASRLIH